MRNVNSHSPEHKPTTCSWGLEKLPLWADFSIVVLYRYIFPCTIWREKCFNSLKHECAYEDRAVTSVTEVVLCHGMKFNQNYLSVLFYPGNSRAFWMHLQAPSACGWEQSSGSHSCQGDQAHSRAAMLSCRWRPLAHLCLTHTLRKHFSEIKLYPIPISHLLNTQPVYLILILIQGISFPMEKHLF